MSSSGLGGGKKVRMKRRREDPWNWIGFISSLNGVDLRQNVVYISFSLSVLLIPSSRDTADRSTFILFF
jgi:hypothetical protein